MGNDMIIVFKEMWYALYSSLGRLSLSWFWQL